MHQVLLAALRPIAMMLLRFGVNYRSFADAAKVAFVQMAAKECREGTGRSNVSRIALMTGLSRKEVRALVGVRESGQDWDQSNVHFPAEVLRVWFTDERFCSREGQPKYLSWDVGESSFVHLVRCVGRNLSAVAIRTELLRVGAICQNDLGELQALRRHFVADAAQERLIEGIQFGLRPLALTLAKNTVIDGRENLRFQRVVDSYSIPHDQRRKVELAIKEKLEGFSEEIDDVLSEASRGATEKELGSAVGVGLFYYDET